nr:immunoglobulin heavy chain junction region [Macaca mulatta]MOV48671.1 immunoglobulin heavy chain junction region [Macaca mulatta]MOV49501.1 immunoglobulin heavy chain junction region [Macaca mulatta]MOV49536.1 immunoglobulin heavy chain junction region [Macaca mulatta]MOV49650.1 immunoglobulin heavy chain junction region [Macaca mulatta]
CANGGIAAAGFDYW